MIAKKRKTERLDPDLFDLLDRYWSETCSREIRKISAFAEAEIIVPRGPLKNTQYSADTKPASRLWFNEIESGEWQTFNMTGVTQGGKTLDAFTIPVCWSLFEKGEDTIVGVPNIERVGNAKWKKDLLPIIKASNFSRLLPSSGAGSREGTKISEITFKNGATLTFMSFVSGDVGAAHDTAANLIMTEVDAANRISEASEEGTKIEQLIGRTLAYGERAFIVKECTVTHDQGIIWSSYWNGSRSKIIRECPLCNHWVTPERKHFLGWQDAKTELEAGRSAKFHCPNCGEPWTDDQRFQANRTSKLIHRGQEVDSEGRITGLKPETSELGFRFSAVDNIFRTSKFLGQRLWKLERSPNKVSSERTMKQQEFAEPIVNITDDDEKPIDAYHSAQRLAETIRNTVPAGCEVITVGTDVRKTQLHVVVGAWQLDATPTIISYSTLKVYSRRMGVERALPVALRYLRDMLSKGFRTADGQIQHVDQWWIDARWQGGRGSGDRELKIVYEFIRESLAQGDFWPNHLYPYLGCGRGKQYATGYRHPTRRTKNITYIGDNYYIVWDSENQIQKVYVNANHFKSFVHDRLRVPQFVLDENGESTGEIQPGAMTLFRPETGDHMEFMRHLTAEKEKTIFVPGPGKGQEQVWDQVSRVNHYFDATYSMCAAAVHCGVTPSFEALQAEQKARTEQAAANLADAPEPYGGPINPMTGLPLYLEEF